MSNTPPSDLPTHHEDHPETIGRVTRYGIILFCIYFALFIGFVLLNVFRPALMKQEDVGGVSLGGPNLAVVYGMGLIFAAIVLALVYMRLTRTPAGR